VTAATVIARALAAAVLAAGITLTASGCHDVTEANVPASPSCPAGQHWQQAQAGGKYACRADDSTGGAP
jgi:hypothetical protein